MASIFLSLFFEKYSTNGAQSCEGDQMDEWVKGDEGEETGKRKGQ